MIIVDVRRVPVGDVDLACTTTGDPADPPVLLVAGLGAQLISWDDEFCQALVDRGLYVIRFDNRDAGLSTHLDEAEAPAYALADLADDAAGLIEVLGLESAHVVGASMGGMIVQLLAIAHPGRVRSVTSIMSTTGDRGGGGGERRRDRAADGASGRDARSRGRGSGAGEQRAGITLLPDRGGGAAGAGGAGLRPGSRSRGLRPPAAGLSDHPRPHRCVCVVSTCRRSSSTAPSTPLIGVSGGRATAAAIPGAELLVIDGMGHELPEAVWPVVVDRIAELVERAEQSRATAHSAGEAASSDQGSRPRRLFRRGALVAPPTGDRCRCGQPLDPEALGLLHRLAVVVDSPVMDVELLTAGQGRHRDRWASGIGAAIVDAFQAKGATAVVVDRTVEDPPRRRAGGGLRL